VAIPISLLVTFSAMKSINVSLNMISMSGLALAIGLLVDNAIVVLENIYRHLDMDKEPKKAAVEGSKEVSMAITASTLTTLSVFLPILFVPGIAGALFRDMVITICFALAASLAVALSAIPAAASRILHAVHRSQKEGTSAIGQTIQKVRGVFGRAVDGYAWFLRKALHFRKTTLILAVAAFVGSVVLLVRVGTDFLAKTDRGFIDLVLTADSSSNLEATQVLAKDIEKIVAKNVPEAILYSTDIGSGEGIGAVFGKGEYGGRLRIKLPPMSKRKRHQLEIEDDLRKRFKNVPGVEVTAQQFSLTGSGGDIEVHIFIDDLIRGRILGEEVKSKLKRIKGLEDVTHSLEEAAPELKVELDRNRLAQLGTNPGLITASISTYFMGSVAGVFQEKGDEYDILVRAPESIRRDVERLKNVPVFLGAGTQMPLASVANIIDSLGPSQVRRKDQRRVVTVTGTMSNRPLGEVLKDVEKTLKGIAWPPDTVWTVGGAAQDMKESFSYLIFAFAAAVLLVYMVMASQFESLLEPFVILFSVPMSIIGVALALYATGTHMTVTAAIGIVMLAGIVVNNAIVLVDYLKQKWDGKWDTLIDAAVEAGKTRLRPILMTTLTTVLAMIPLARGVGEGAETWAPMARAVIGGLITSTLLTLVVVPAWYVIIAGTVARFKERRQAKKAAKAA
jgi:HAE1 family hydrophobic/amphiphilic exporter-1